MEVLNSVLAWVLGILGGVSFTAIGIFILRSVIISIGKKIAEKITLKKFHDELMEEHKKSVKEISFKQSIEPLVLSNLEKVNEKVDERLTRELKELKTRNDKLVNIIKCFASFFDDSYMVNAEKKQALQEAFEDYKIIEPIQDQEIVVENKEKENHEQNNTEPQNKPEKAKNKTIR